VPSSFQAATGTLGDVHINHIYSLCRKGGRGVENFLPGRSRGIPSLHNNPVLLSVSYRFEIFTIHDTKCVKKYGVRSIFFPVASFFLFFVGWLVPLSDPTPSSKRCDSGCKIGDEASTPNNAKSFL